MEHSFYRVEITKSEKGNDVVLLTIRSEDGKETKYFGSKAVKITHKYWNVFSDSTREYVKWLFEMTQKSYLSKNGG